MTKGKKGTKQKSVAEEAPQVASSVKAHEPEFVAPSMLKPHPRNYRVHPDDQIAHIQSSIAEHGFYRNVVVAKDYTILAGHGVVEAVNKMGLFGPETVPVVRIDVDPDDPVALKILTGDNEIGKLAEVNDRVLSEVLKDLATVDQLIGTGFDPASLAAFVAVSRPVEEVRDKNEAAEWLGMPAFDMGEQVIVLNVRFLSEEDRATFVAQTGVGVSVKKKDGRTWSGWWPPIERQKLVQDLLFTDEEA